MCEAIKRFKFATPVQNLEHNYDGYNSKTI